MRLERTDKSAATGPAAARAARTYAEHPEDRSAIGTEAEHTRLLAALSSGAYGVARPPAPEPPAPVRVATRLGYAGIVFGLSTALTDAVLTFALEDRLKAHAVEAGERAVREFGDKPADWESSVYFTQSIYVIILLVMAVLSGLAFMATRDPVAEFGNMAFRSS